MADIEDFFVKQAPCAAKRSQIFAAFRIWIDQLKSLSPTAILWIDGGFVTYKDVPPKDVDVAALVSPRELNSWSADQQELFMSLMTDVGPGTRVQPMAGLVDGFFAVKGDVDQTLVWDKTWSAVYVDGHPVVGESKGYLEVRLADD